MTALTPPARGRPESGARGAGALIAVLLIGLVLALPAGARMSHPQAPPFYVEATADPPSGEVPLSVAFNVTTTSGSATGYSWSFGDGSWLNGTEAADADPVHTYSTAGEFPVEVTVWEGSVSESTEIQVLTYVGPLQVVLTATPERGSSPLTVLFTTNVSGGTGTYVGFDWTFGDGGVGTGPEVANTYRFPGTYLAHVTVSDSAGTTVTEAVQVVVSGSTSGSGGPLSPPLMGAVVVLASGAVGLTIAASLTWRGRRMFPDSPSLPASDLSTEAIPPGGTMASPASEPGLGAVVGEAAESDASEVPPTDLARGLSPEYVAEGRRISHRIVLRLASLGHLHAEDTPDVRWTQQGLMEHLGMAQSRVSNVLRRLEAAGILEVETRHVAGRSRRVKVYRLTSRGESLARSYRQEGSGARPPDPATARPD